MAYQGLPYKPCPKMRCDNTVLNTIYDLFLCGDCERICDEERMKVGANTENPNESSVGETAVRSGRQHKQSTQTATVTLGAVSAENDLRGSQSQLKLRSNQKSNTVKEATKLSQHNSKGRKPSVPSGGTKAERKGAVTITDNKESDGG